jgi:sigma-E factor negative regulatory protein RseB
MLASASAFSQTSPSPEQPEVGQIVRQIQQAARTLNYVGVFAFQQGERFESSRITHFFDGKNEKERIEVLDGLPREYLRVNDEVQGLMPDRKLVLLERQRGDRFPGLLLNQAQTLEKNYSLRLAPELLRIAGRSCRGIEITPRDTHRYGYRLCADLESNLLLKAQMVGPEGVVIEQVAFTQVTIGADITEAMLTPSWVTTDWRVVRAQHSKVDLFAQGWRISAPAGYVPTSQQERIFSNDKRVNQLVLSDGLATISIFIEPYQPERSEYEPQGAARSGSVNIFGIKVANFWLTVLGEVPAATLEQLAQSIQYVPSTPAR